VADGGMEPPGLLVGCVQVLVHLVQVVGGFGAAGGGGVGVAGHCIDEFCSGGEVGAIAAVLSSSVLTVAPSRCRSQSCRPPC